MVLAAPNKKKLLITLQLLSTYLLEYSTGSPRTFQEGITWKNTTLFCLYCWKNTALRESMKQSPGGKKKKQ